MNADQFGKFQENARFYLDRLSWRRQYIANILKLVPSWNLSACLRSLTEVREDDFSSAQSEKPFHSLETGADRVPLY